MTDGHNTTLARTGPRRSDSLDRAWLFASPLLRYRSLGERGYHRCAVCGSAGPFCAYSPSLGGVVCEACWAADTGAEDGGAGPCFALSAGAAATLQVLLDKPLAELEGFDIDDRAAAEVEQVVTQTLGFHGH